MKKLEGERGGEGLRWGGGALRQRSSTRTHDSLAKARIPSKSQLKYRFLKSEGRGPWGFLRTLYSSFICPKMLPYLIEKKPMC